MPRAKWYLAHSSPTQLWDGWRLLDYCLAHATFRPRAASMAREVRSDHDGNLYGLLRRDFQRDARLLRRPEPYGFKIIVLP